jgi:phage terminase small subunit
MTPEQREAIEQLPRLAQRVVMERIADPLASQSECYRRAGGDAKTPSAIRSGASEILTHPDVIVILDSFKIPVDDERIAGREEILRELTTLSRLSVFDILDLINADDELVNMNTGDVITGKTGLVIRSKNDIPEELRRCVKTIKPKAHGLEVEFHDVVKARQLLVEIQGLAAPTKLEHSGVVATREASDDEFFEMLNGLGVDANE